MKGSDRDDDDFGVAGVDKNVTDLQPAIMAIESGRNFLAYSQ